VLRRLHHSYVTLRLPRGLESPLALLERALFERDLRAIPIERPIFIIGSHRSGTTVLYEALARHPDLAYFTNASNLLPRLPTLMNLLSRALGLDQVAQERFLQDDIQFTATSPNEGIRIWELHTPDAPDHCLDETHDDTAMEAYLRATIRKHLRYFRASRFINKNPDNSARMRYLNRLFPDAYFIHIVRDGRAVCSSLLKARGLATDFFGPEHRHATSGIRVKGWEAIAQEWDRDPVVGSGMLWRESLATIERDRAAIAPERYMEIRYEDFMMAPAEHLRGMLRFCRLRRDARIDAIIDQAAGSLSVEGRNDAWRKRLAAADVDRLMDVIGPTMRRYGYPAEVLAAAR
jgi:hypothetical protein